MRSRIEHWLRDAVRRVQRGQGLVEYGLLITLISVAAIAIMAVLGGSVTSLYAQATSVFP
jgi:Flp pilus assembly pilin Flp